MHVQRKPGPDKRKVFGPKSRRQATMARVHGPKSKWSLQKSQIKLNNGIGRTLYSIWWYIYGHFLNKNKDNIKKLIKVNIQSEKINVKEVEKDRKKLCLQYKEKPFLLNQTKK